MFEEKTNLGQCVDDPIKSKKDRITRKLGGFSFLYAYHKARLAKKLKDRESERTLMGVEIRFCVCRPS